MLHLMYVRMTDEFIYWLVYLFGYLFIDRLIDLIGYLYMYLFH